MARTEELNDAPLRIVYDDDGAIADIIDERGASKGFVFGKKHPVTGGINLLAGSDVVQAPGEHINFGASNLSKWRKALGRARSGGAPVKVALIGDSTTRGAGSNGSPSANVVSNSYPTYLAALLNKSMIKTQANSWWGDGTFGVALSALDPRVAMTGGWYASAINTVGGKVMAANATGTLSFTPTVACKTYDVWYIRSGGNGIFSLDVGGVGTTNFDTGSSGIGLSKATITAASATLSPLNIKYVSGNVFFITAVECYDDTDQLFLRNMGKSGAKVSDWVASTSSPWDPIAALATFAADLSIIDLTINDAAQSTDVAAYKAYMQTLINAAQATGDVILKIGVPTSTAVSSQAAQDTLRAANYSLAKTNNLPLIDLVQRFGTFADANTLGLFYDNYHPNAVGYADVASSAAKALALTGL